MLHNELFCVEEDKYLLFNEVKGIWISIDGIGKDIYSAYMQNDDIDCVCRSMSEIYGVSSKELYSDVYEFIDDIKNKGFLDEADSTKSEIFENKLDKRNYPYNVLIISVTDSCNLDCIYCFNKKERSFRKDKYIKYNLDQLKDVLDRFKNDGGNAVLFTGGEPLLYEGLIDLCRIAHDAGLKTSVISNATLLADMSNLEDLLGEIDSISLSLDSVDENELAVLWNKKNINIARIQQGLLRLNEYSKKIKKMFITILPIVTKCNSDNLFELFIKVRQCLNECIVKIEPTQYSPIGEEVDEELEITEDEYVNAYINAFKKAGMQNKNIEFAALSHNGRYSPHLRREKMLCKPSLFIKTNGDVYPCQHLLEDEYYLGNVVKDSYDTITESFERIMQKENQIKDRECLECALREICSLKGGICEKGHRSDCKEAMIKLMNLYVCSLE